MLFVFLEPAYALGFDIELVGKGGQAQDAPRTAVVLHLLDKKRTTSVYYRVILV